MIFRILNYFCLRNPVFPGGKDLEQDSQLFNSTQLSEPTQEIAFPLGYSPHVSPWPIQNQSTIPETQQFYTSFSNYHLLYTAQSHSNDITSLFKPQWPQTMPVNGVFPMAPPNLLPNKNVSNDYGLNQDIQFPSGEQISAETTPCSTYTVVTPINNQQEIPSLGDDNIWQRYVITDSKF